MLDLFKFMHNFETCSIAVPEHIDIHNDSMSFKIELGHLLSLTGLPDLAACNAQTRKLANRNNWRRAQQKQANTNKHTQNTSRDTSGEIIPSR